MTCPCNRYLNAGRMTNYEMGPLRLAKEWRRVDGKRLRWIYPWSSLADEFHPRSQEEWDKYQEGNQS